MNFAYEPSALVFWRHRHIIIGLVARLIFIRPLDAPRRCFPFFLLGYNQLITNKSIQANSKNWKWNLNFWIGKINTFHALWSAEDIETLLFTSSASFLTVALDDPSATYITNLIQKIIIYHTNFQFIQNEWNVIVYKIKIV